LPCQAIQRPGAIRSPFLQFKPQVAYQEQIKAPPYFCKTIWRPGEIAPFAPS